MTRRFIETYYGHRYLISEVAIASGLRSVDDTHWNFCARALVDRQKRYRDASERTHWVMVPTKVSAHRGFLTEYLGRRDVNEWAWQLIDRVSKQAGAPIFYTPWELARLDAYFRFDSHWTGQAASEYMRAALLAAGISPGSVIQTPQFNKGNCHEAGDGREAFSLDVCPSWETVLSVSGPTIPDFSVTVGRNSLAQGRVLVLHSSSYTFAAGMVRSAFGETVEVFSPYVPADVIAHGCFDAILVFMAERNAPVVYDGGAFGDRIQAALRRQYIADIAKRIGPEGHASAATSKTKAFLSALGTAWEVK